MTDANPSTGSKQSRTTRAQRVFASLIAGASVDEISAAERLTRKRTESLLRQELRNSWVAQAEEFARVQIARLEQMILKLLDRLQTGIFRRSTGRSKSLTDSTAITGSPGRRPSPNRTAERSGRGS